MDAHIGGYLGSYGLESIFATMSLNRLENLQNILSHFLVKCHLLIQLSKKNMKVWCESVSDGLRQQLKSLQAFIPYRVISREESTSQWDYYFLDQCPCLLGSAWCLQELREGFARHKGVRVVSLEEALETVDQKGIIVELYRDRV